MLSCLLTTCSLYIVGKFHGWTHSKAQQGSSHSAIEKAGEIVVIRIVTHSIIFKDSHQMMWAIVVNIYIFICDRKLIKSHQSYILNVIEN